MVRGTAVLVSLGCLIVPSVRGLAGAPGAAGSASPSEHVALERFLTDIEKAPVSYQAHRRLEASSTKLRESAWLEADTAYDPDLGFRYVVTAQGGSERIQRRVLKAVLKAEQQHASHEEWRKSSLSRTNYQLDFGGHAGEGMLKMQLTPRRRDSRLVLGSALLSAKSGNLVRVEGRLSKSPSFWVRWVQVARSYSAIGGSMMPVAVESYADVRIAGMSTFAMTYEYQMVDGRTVGVPTSSSLPRR
jgi:hypothetical protein